MAENATSGLAKANIKGKGHKAWLEGPTVLKNPNKLYI
jgi:hypothetical protein